MPGMSDPVAFSHIHAAGRDLKDGTLLLATHEGLFAQDRSGRTMRGPVMDLMGFAVSSDGTYYASGHPGPGTDLPQPLGLIRSTDSGRTWTVVSRGAESDFHSLAAVPGLIVGFDGTLRVSADGKAWQDAPITDQPYAVSVTPGGRILATTSSGLLASTDRGKTWRPIATPKLLLTVAALDEETLVAATTDGTLTQTTDGGATWTTGPRSLGEVTAVSATRRGGRVEIVAVVGSTVLTTTDLGNTTIKAA